MRIPIKANLIEVAALLFFGLYSAIVFIILEFLMFSQDSEVFRVAADKNKLVRWSVQVHYRRSIFI